MAASEGDRAFFRAFTLLARIATLLLVGFLSHRALFLLHGERTQGRVVAILPAEDPHCIGNYIRDGPCRRLVAVVHFEIGDRRTSGFAVFAAPRKLGEPDLDRARYAVDEIVPVLYDPSRPRKAYVADIRDFWKMPLLFFVGAGSSWFAAWLWPKAARRPHSPELDLDRVP